MADDELMDGEVDNLQPTAQGGMNRIIKILIYAALGAVGLVLMVVIAYYVAAYAAAKQYKDVASIVVVKPPPPLESFNFPQDFRVNTADTSETHFVKMKMSLGFDSGNAALAGELAQRKPQLRHIINLILKGKRKSQLNTDRDQLNLATEIKSSINHVLSNGKIKDVYFLELIVN